MEPKALRRATELPVPGRPLASYRQLALRTFTFFSEWPLEPPRAALGPVQDLIVGPDPQGSRTFKTSRASRPPRASTGLLARASFPRLPKPPSPNHLFKIRGIQSGHHLKKTRGLEPLPNSSWRPVWTIPPCGPKSKPCTRLVRTLGRLKLNKHDQPGARPSPKLHPPARLEASSQGTI